MQEYSNQLKEQAKLNTCHMDIPFSTKNHYIQANKILIKQSKSHIKILTNELDLNDWKYIKDDLITFLEKKGSIQILTIKPVNKKTIEFIEELKSNGKVKHFEFNAENYTEKETIKLANNLPEFLIGDNTKSVYKDSNNNLKNKMVLGLVNFNNAKRNNNLSNMFNKLITISD